MICVPVRREEVQDMLNELFHYFAGNYEEVLSLCVEHIELTALALLAAIALGIPLGILISYVRPAGKPVMAFANLVQAVPSMALLGLTIPVLGIGMKPAICLVVIYSLLPIIKNTYAGLMNINAQTLEAAEGIGLTKGQILFKVRIPLALPVIMTGVRISAVSAVGLMTLAAFVGGGGLGSLVFAGIRTVDNVKILAGAIPACILALLVDRLFAAVEVIVTPMSFLPGTKEGKHRRKRKESCIVAAAVLLLAALFAATVFAEMRTAGQTGSQAEKLRIGSMDFSENEVLMYMLAEAIETGTDISVETVPDLGGSSICFTSVQSGDIDGYVEYTGTIYVSILKKEAISDVQKVYDEAKTGMQQYGLEVLNSLNVNNTYTLSTTKEISEQYGLKKISDLKKRNGQYRAICTLTFLNRADGLPAVKKAYGLQFAEETGVDGAARYTALMSGEGDLIDAYSTDGLLEKFGLVVLEDDEGVFPPYYAVPVFREEVMKAHPELAEITEKLGSVLSTEAMAKLNYQVDEGIKTAEEAAHAFLAEQLPDLAEG